MWKQYKKKSIYARSRVELFLDEEESSLEDDKSFSELSIKEIVDVGSPQVSFLMCTLEIPQKIAVQVLLLLTLFTFTFEPFLKL